MISQQPCPTLSSTRLASAVKSPFAASLLAKAQSIAQDRCQSLQLASRGIAEQIRSFSSGPALAPLCHASQGWHKLSALVGPDSGAAAASPQLDRDTRALLTGRNAGSAACAAVRAPPDTSSEALPPPPANTGQRAALPRSPAPPALPAPAPQTPLFAAIQWLFVQQLDTLMKGRADSIDYMSADMRVRIAINCRWRRRWPLETSGRCPTSSALCTERREGISLVNHWSQRAFLTCLKDALIICAQMRGCRLVGARVEPLSLA